MSSVSLGDLRDALLTVDFPADKDVILRAAQEQGAGEDVLAALRSLPPAIEYANKDEVIRSVHADVGSEPTAAQKADPDTTIGKSGVAEHLR
jgi:hypothetical protein